MPSVFLSYSHKDEVWKDRLQTHLRVLEKQGLLETWEDRRIGGGSGWLEDIQEAMERASVAVLLISADFLTSEFILKEEVPRLLQRQRESGLSVLPVIVRSCAWKEVGWFREIQVLPPDGKPLASFTGDRRDAELANIALEIRRMLRAEDALARREQANLAGHDLRGKDLSGQDLSGADLSGADLTAARLVGTRLASARLIKARLREADLNTALLTGADLTGADLTGARLVGADLRGAHLEQARLRHAKLLGAVLDAGAFEESDTFGAAWSHLGDLGVQIRAKRVCQTVAWSPDGELLASTHENLVFIWNANCRREIRALVGHQSTVWSVGFSPDGKTIASASSDNTVRLWQTDSGSEIKTLTGHQDTVWSVTFSPDGKTIASASSDNTVRLWQTDSGSEIKILTGHQDTVWSVTFSPDGKTIASASSDNTVRLWQTNSGSEIKTLTGHQEWVRSVVFSPDGKTLASASDDNTVRLWPTEFGSEIKTLTGVESRVIPWPPFRNISWRTEGGREQSRIGPGGGGIRDCF